MKTAVLYRIDCLPSGRYYIGQARVFGARKHTHLADLHAGRHINRKLQLDFLHHGEEAFHFSVVKEVSIAEINAEEGMAIRSARANGHDIYNSTHYLASNAPLGRSQAAERQAMRYMSKEPEPDAALEPLITLQDAASYLRVKESYAGRMLRMGDMPVEHVVLPNGDVLLREASFAAWVASRTYFPESVEAQP